METTDYCTIEETGHFISTYRHMTTLLVLGNINQFTFANSIIVANAKAEEMFEQALTNIFVVHSKDSYSKLKSNEDWVNHIEINGVDRELFVDKIIEITAKETSIKKFVDYVEFIFKGIPDDSNLIVDLTNGTSLQKNLLSIVSYILDIKNQYIIDVSKLFELTNERRFIPIDILLSCYTIVPDSTRLDSIAYLNLSEMVRYRKIIENHTNKYVAIDSDSSDQEFFKDNLGHSIQLKLQGDKSKDNAIYRIAASSISASVEDLIRLLVSKFILADSPDRVDRKTFGQKLKIIQAKIEKDAPSDFDVEFFSKFNDFILYLRNSSTHKGKLLTDVEKFKAELSVKMAFPFIEFYTDIVYPLLSSGELSREPKQIKKLSYTDIALEETLYYGLDGDDTGKILEELFLACSDEASFRKLSKDITNAISKIAKVVTDELGKNAIVFEAGDDLLFKGNLPEEKLLEMQAIYSQSTPGLTCSIGYGRSFQEVYLALKLAKTQPGKNAIVGIELC
ncbi:mCpol domain-containing protein [Anabaena sp. UHCC 0187]|uniref:mCpol domain-containing protein n=1 Tax=Anabaena sp. UHCC 0187 TaxID=2590018 RepID=UPI0020C1EEC6|nr:mCpol domain-containing protein [Anabaena sp. UHCC 0187]